jgi:hypothetical protein
VCPGHVTCVQTLALVRLCPAASDLTSLGLASSRATSGCKATSEGHWRLQELFQSVQSSVAG